MRWEVDPESRIVDPTAVNRVLKSEALVQNLSVIGTESEEMTLHGSLSTNSSRDGGGLSSKMVHERLYSTLGYDETSATEVVKASGMTAAMRLALGVEDDTDTDKVNLVVLESALDFDAGCEFEVIVVAEDEEEVEFMGP